MMLNLENKQWLDFFIEDIGKIFSGRDIYETERIDGNTPYISSTAKNNGIGYFVGNNNATLEKNCLSVNRNGSVGYSFYHPYQGLFSNDCRKIKLKHESKEIGFFIANQITMQKEKYNYGYKMGTGRLKRQKILLPINEDEKPDYEFMEQCVKLIFDKKLNHYKQYTLNTLKGLKYVEIPSLEEVEWKEFYIGGKEGIFRISSTSSSIDKNKLITASVNCNIPYITRTDMTNGINQFISKSQNPKYQMDEGNVITIGLDTQTVFYQPYKFFTGQNIQVLRHQSLNKHNALFLIPLLKVQMEKFNWGGNGATLGRLSRTKLMLPVDANGNPDWGFMEQYMKNLEFTKINQYLDFLESQNSL